MDNSTLIAIRKSSKLSRGEKKVADFLKENGVEFYREWFFREMAVKNKWKVLFFDFYVPDYKLCIEFDGEQHYTRRFNGKRIKNGYNNDFLKTAFCKSKGIRLLRIKYDQIDNIETLICEYFDKHF